MALPEARPSNAQRWAESDRALVERLRQDIQAEGPIPFARFMATVLYDPTHGYYATSDDRTTRAGDYLTAPDLDPIFGATLAGQVEEAWERLGRPAPFILREEAAGSGALGLAILGRLATVGSPAAGAIRYLPIEASPAREAGIRRRVAEAGFGAWLARTAVTDRPMVGMVLANELLDALPVHRLTMRDGELWELHVDWQHGWFAEVALPPPTPEPRLALGRVGVGLVEGQVAEVGLAAAAWVRGLGSRLERGLAMVIDYGHPARALYDPEVRPHGLLRTYHRHHVGDDPYRFVGEQDLTAHVDWTSLELAASDGGLDILGRTTQAEALSGLGLGARLVELQSRPGITADAYAVARAAVMRLIDPQALGGFGVLVLGRGIATTPPLLSLSFRMPRREAAPTGGPTPTGDDGRPPIERSATRSHTAG
jgi:SAM-dependent MidA family methyltransferase